MDEWIVAQGGRPISSNELREFLAQVQWANVKAENPGDPDFPLATVFR